MKHKKIPVMIALMALLIVLPVMAYDVECRFKIDNINISETEITEAYVLNCPQIRVEESIKNTLYIIFDEDYSGIYTKRDADEFPILLKNTESMIEDLINEDFNLLPIISINDISYYFLYESVLNLGFDVDEIPTGLNIDVENVNVMILISTTANSALDNPRYDTIKINNDLGYSLMFFETEELTEQILFFVDDEENPILLIEFDELNIFFDKEDLDEDLVKKRGVETDIFVTEGEMIPDCYDSDVEEENPYTVFGYARGRIGGSNRVVILTDFCSGNLLHEAVCRNNRVGYEIVECEDKCVGGVCIVEDEEAETDLCVSLDDPQLTITSLTREISDIKYSDFKRIVSTQAVTIGGYASGTEIGINDLWKDYCANEHTLIEYFCDINKARFTKIICPNGCEDGRCVEGPYCWESDGGNNIHFKGTTYFYSVDAENDDAPESYTDYCIDRDTLREYYCKYDNYTHAFGFEDITCPGDTVCSKGRCVDFECEEDDDCSAGEICVERFCEISCNESTDCPLINGETLGCVDGICVPCEEDEDCAEGWICNDEGRCEIDVLRCDDSDDCPETVDTETGLKGTLGCIENLCEPCEENEDCAGNKICLNGICRFECTTHLNCAINEDCVDNLCTAEDIGNYADLKDAIWRRIQRLRIFEFIIRQIAEADEIEPWCDYDGICEYGETSENCPDCELPVFELHQEVSQIISNRTYFLRDHEDSFDSHFPKDVPEIKTPDVVAPERIQTTTIFDRFRFW